MFYCLLSFIIINYISHNNALILYWQKYVMPFPPLSIDNFIKIIELIYKLFLFNMTFKYNLYFAYSFL